MLRPSMTVNYLIGRLWLWDLFDRLVSFRVGRVQCKLLLTLICVNFFSVEVWVLWDHLRFHLLWNIFLNLVYFSAVQGDVFSVLGKLVLIIWSKDEKSVNNGVCIFEPLSEVFSAVRYVVYMRWILFQLHLAFYHRWARRLLLVVAASCINQYLLLLRRLSRLIY